MALRIPGLNMPGCAVAHGSDIERARDDSNSHEGHAEGNASQESVGRSLSNEIHERTVHGEEDVMARRHRGMRRVVEHA